MEAEKAVTKDAKGGIRKSLVGGGERGGGGGGREREKLVYVEIIPLFFASKQFISVCKGVFTV